MQDRIIKVISWRIVSITVTMIVMFLFTGNIREATALTLFLHAFLTIANYIFETLWEKFYETRRLD